MKKEYIINFSHKFFLLFIFIFLLLFLKINQVNACQCGLCGHPSGYIYCCTCSPIGGGGGSDPYKHPPTGNLDVLNCNEMAGWACDPSCTGDRPPCYTDITVYDKVIPWRIRNDNDPVVGVGFQNCTSCDWGQTGNFSAVYCGRCPGECSSLKCNYAWAHKVASIFTSNNVNRPDLANVGACRGSTQHGFSVRTPSSVIDGTTHYLTFVANNQGTGYNVSINGNRPVSYTHLTLPTIYSV